jgi:hypothetical protein
LFKTSAKHLRDAIFVMLSTVSINWMHACTHKESPNNSIRIT